MIQKAFREILTAAPAVVEIVADRIRPVTASQQDAMPCLIYQKISDEALNRFDGSSAFRNARVQVDAYAATYEAVQELAKTVKQALHHFKGTAGGLYIAPILLDESTDVEQSPEAGEELPVYRISQDYTALYRNI